jgi:hypothetical protein
MKISERYTWTREAQRQSQKKKKTNRFVEQKWLQAWTLKSQFYLSKNKSNN